MAKNPFELVNNSIWWTRERLHQMLVKNVYSDIRLLGGGEFSVKMAMRYCYHSRNHLSLYYSNLDEYKSMLMVRNIKKKMSKFNINKPPTSSDKNHHVLLYFREPDEVIHNKYPQFDYPVIALQTKSTCLGRHGKRDISICGHRGAAYYFVWLWYHHMTGNGIPDPTPRATRYFGKMINCDDWIRKYHKLSNDEKYQRHMLVRLLYAF